jgi:acetyl-CoA C-acetyltransferase
MNQPVIVSGVRTAIGRFGGGFKDYSAADLGAEVMRAALERANVSPSMIEDVVVGNVFQLNHDSYTGRLAALKAGIPEEVPAININRWCSSGLEAINMAAQLIMTGEADIVLAAGVENMSQVPYIMRHKVRWGGLRLGNAEFEDGLIGALNCPVYHYHMGITAENVASRFEVTREEQDEIALISQQRAAAAWENGLFDKQIIPVTVPQGRGEPLVVQKDEHLRPDTTLERLAKLPSAFKENGTVTAGNASGLNDGAAAVVMMSEAKASELGMHPRLRWVGRAAAGVDPSVMGIGPVPAVRKVVQKTGVKLEDIDLIELNEAFAAQAAYCIRELGLDIERVNVNGSGISLGHPVGATGAIMTVKLMDELERRDERYGLATMCVGGGQGVATIFERIN